MEVIKGVCPRTAASSVASTSAAPGPPNHRCGGCGELIKDRYLLQALNVYWHEDCLKCGCCDCRLGEVGSTLYTRANLIMCKRDYLRLFGTTGNCAACSKAIPAFEMVMRAKNNVYHLDCFACSCCHQRFCVGDSFYLHENRILCKYDYEDRFVCVNMAPTPSVAAGSQSYPSVDTEASYDWNSTMGAAGLEQAAARRGTDEKRAAAVDKQDSPVGGDASSSGYDSPDSGLIDES